MSKAAVALIWLALLAPVLVIGQTKSIARTPGGHVGLPLRIRCVSRGLPMVPTPNNNFFQFVQGAGYVAILQEMMYEARIIPLDGRPHAPREVRGYMGDARGRWEGDALVIDT